MKTLILVFVFVFHNLFFAGFASGQEFTNVKVNHLTEGRQAMWGSNSLQVHDGIIYAVWSDGRNRDDGGLDVFISNSVNDGVDFSADVMINNPDLFPGQQRFGPEIVTRDNHLYVAWYTENKEIFPDRSLQNRKKSIKQFFLLTH